MMTFSSAPTTRVAPATRPLRASDSHPSSSDRKTQLTDFFKSPKVLRARFRCMTSFTSPRDFYFDICERHILLRARQHLSSSLHLTHVLSRKVLSLTKPKGKIYKTKSLGHYITYSFIHSFILQQVKLPRVILCLEVIESQLIHVHIYIFVQLILKNTYNLQTDQFNA